MSAFLLSIREGLEAVLIVSILLGSVRRLGHNDLARFVWLGVAAALAVSIAGAAALSAAGFELEGVREQVFEGITLLLAATVLTAMLFWMRRQGANLSRELAAKVRRAATDAPGPESAAGEGPTRPYSGAALFSIAFLAVVREGVELALLLAASAFSSSISATATGAAVGLATAAAFGGLLFRGVVKLNLKRFFQVTNVILILFATGMFALGVHEFVEAGLLPAFAGPVWNLGRVLSDESTAGGLLRALLGYVSDPTPIEVLAYAGYFAAVGWALWLRKPPQTHAARAAEGR